MTTGQRNQAKIDKSLRAAFAKLDMNILHEIADKFERVSTVEGMDIRAAVRWVLKSSVVAA